METYHLNSMTQRMTSNLNKKISSSETMITVDLRSTENNKQPSLQKIKKLVTELGCRCIAKKSLQALLVIFQNKIDKVRKQRNFWKSIVEKQCKKSHFQDKNFQSFKDLKIHSHSVSQQKQFDNNVDNNEGNDLVKINDENFDKKIKNFYDMFNAEQYLAKSVQTQYQILNPGQNMQEQSLLLADSHMKQSKKVEEGNKKGCLDEISTVNNEYQMLCNSMFLQMRPKTAKKKMNQTACQVESKGQNYQGKRKKLMTNSFGTLNSVENILHISKDQNAEKQKCMNKPTTKKIKKFDQFVKEKLESRYMFDKIHSQLKDYRQIMPRTPRSNNSFHNYQLL